MKRAFRDEWCAALRSGKWKQGKGALQDDDKFCCLGVRCEMSGIDPIREAERNKGDEFPHPLTLELWGMTQSAAEYLAQLNDGGASFSFIADHLDEFAVED